jgi:hypothetical protein
MAAKTIQSSAETVCKDNGINAPGLF